VKLYLSTHEMIFTRRGETWRMSSINT